LISPTFYAKLLCTQIPKAQKNIVKPLVFFVLVGSACVKALHKMVVKLTPVAVAKINWNLKSNLYIKV